MPLKQPIMTYIVLLSCLGCADSVPFEMPVFDKSFRSKEVIQGKDVFITGWALTMALAPSIQDQNMLQAIQQTNALMLKSSGMEEEFKASMDYALLGQKADKVKEKYVPKSVQSLVGAWLFIIQTDKQKKIALEVRF